VEHHRQMSTIVTNNRAPDETVAMMLAQLTIDRLQSAAFEFIVEGPSHW
jgi:hypothetical protein